MKFSIKEWRDIYNMVQNMGQMLKDSYPWVEYSQDGEKIANHPPRHPIDEDSQLNLVKEIKRLTRKSSNYLDSSGLHPRRPLWIYNPKDQTTWESDPSFKYGHLM